MELTHLGIAVIMDDYNKISLSPMDLRFPDGVERYAYLMWAGWIADQQEMDRICCETSQKCKQCVAPKNRLHEPHTVFARRRAKDVERAVRDAAYWDSARSGSWAAPLQAGDRPQEQAAALVPHSSVH